MTRWADIPPPAPRPRFPQVSAAPPRSLSVSFSVLVHVVAFSIIWLLQSGLLSKTAQPATPEVDTLLFEPTPYRPPEPPMVLPRLRLPPAPKPRPPAPPAPKPDDNRPLLGWTSHGEKPGIALRPPGPTGERFGPEAPGEKGKGMKDAGTGPPGGGEVPPTPERAPGAESQAGADKPPPESLPQYPGGEFGRRGGQGGTPRPLPEGPAQGHGGRPGARGSGDDFNLGMGGGFFGDVMFESGDYNWSDYSTKLYFAVFRAWLREMDGRIPRFERDQALRSLPNLDGEVAIRFVLHRNGSVNELEILRESPMPAFDEASSAALRRAVLPALPDDFPRNQERVTFLFRLSGFETARQLQMQLEYSQARGDF